MPCLADRIPCRRRPGSLRCPSTTRRRPRPGQPPRPHASCRRRQWRRRGAQAGERELARRPRPGPVLGPVQSGRRTTGGRAQAPWPPPLAPESARGREHGPGPEGPSRRRGRTDRESTPAWAALRCCQHPVAALCCRPGWRAWRRRRPGSRARWHSSGWSGSPSRGPRVPCRIGSGPRTARPDCYMARAARDSLRSAC